MAKKAKKPKKLTDAALAKAKRPGIMWDAATTGLGFKVLPSRKKWFVMNLRWPGQRTQAVRNLPGGAYPAMSLATAREKAGQYYALAKAGTDPFELEEEQRRQVEVAKRAEAAKRLNTFAALAEDYITERSGNRRAVADAQEIRRLLVSEWAAKPVHEIEPDDVRALIEQIKRRSAYSALAAWGHATQIFKLAVDKKLVAASPCASLNKKRLFKNAKIGPRQRTLNDEEVFAFWRASGRLGYPAGPLYRLLLLTGCRLNEIADAKWEELHPELRRTLRDASRKRERVDWSAVPAAHKLLTIPRERFKSDREHQVPLSDDACVVLEGVSRLGDHIFTISGEGPVWLGDKYKRRIDARMLRTLRALARKRGDDPEKVRLAPWINHDLRRVVRSNLSGLHNHDSGPLIPDHVSELVLGHGRQGLQGIYDQNKYAPDIRNALERWAARLREIGKLRPPAPTSPPAKIVSLNTRRRGAR